MRAKLWRLFSGGHPLEQASDHLDAPFSKCLNLGKNFRSCGKWTYNNGDLEWPLSNIRTCLMNPYYKLYVYFLGPKILTEIETLKAKLEKGAEASLDE